MKKNEPCTVKLPFDIEISAEACIEEGERKSVDIIVTYPDGIRESICCADYDEKRGLLRVLTFDSAEEAPVFVGTFLQDLNTKCPSFIPERYSAYPLCDNEKCHLAKKCCKSAHMNEKAYVE